MMHQSYRSSKLRWTSTLLSLCLFTGALDGSLGVPNSGHAQSTPLPSAEQTNALAEAERLNQQVMQLYRQGRYNEALPISQRALQIREQQLGKNHPDVAESLNNLAGIYWQQGRYEEVEPLLLRAQAIWLQQLGKDHFYMALMLNNLAELYKEQGRYIEVESMLQQSLTILERQSDKNKLYIAAGLFNLAELYQKQGRYGEAEPLYLRSLEIRMQKLGKDHLDVADSLNNLATLYQAQGRYKEAEPLFQRSVQIWESQLGKDNLDVAAGLNNLADLYKDQSRYTEAELLFQRSVQIWENQLGKDSPYVATGLNNLALLYQDQGRYEEAEPLLLRSLNIRERQLGKDHINVADSLHNLALLYKAQSRYEKAESFYRQSLAISEQQMGKGHPSVAINLNSLAELYRAQGDINRAVTSFTEGLEIQEQNLVTNLAFGSESQKQRYIATLFGTTNAAISLNLQSAPNDSNAARFALTTTIRRKGRILDALTDNLNRLRQNLTPADQQKIDQLAAVRTQLATLYYSSLGNRTPEQYRAQITQLQQQATQLEADLNNRSIEFRTTTQPIELAAVQAQIPIDAALVELVQYQPFNPKSKPNGRWGKPHYAAYVLSPQGTIQAVDLGEAETIDLQAEAFRIALRNSDRRVKAIARKLDAVLMQPIRQKLGNTRNILLSPDSQLNLIPFAALVDENDRYLVETYTINYLTSGRDLLRLQNPVASRQSAVLIANPDYANPGNPKSIARSQPRSPTAIASNSPRSGLGEGQGVRAANRRSTDLTQLQFNPLPGTLAEAKVIAPKLPNATVLLGSDATENALKQVQAPRILHIATHGFFLQDAISSTSASRGPFLSPVMTDSYPSGIRLPASGNTENALLRSGLALAGFNRRQSGSEDGVLTAQEAAGLDLRGTQLVVLSACETGVGNVANGEGVYGLRRAFVLAGAASQLTSLWQVSDDGTKDLMVQYYDRLLAGAGRGDALRQTQLEFLKNPDYQHPYYWAAFIPSGDWRPLK